MAGRAGGKDDQASAAAEAGQLLRHASQLVAERGGFDLMPEMGYQPVNKYLPPRWRPTPAAPPVESRREPTGVLRWIDRVLSR